MWKSSRFSLVIYCLIGWFLIYAALIILTKIAPAHSLAELAMVGLLAPLNFLPTIIAYLRRHHNVVAIAVLNAIFGAFAGLSMGLGGFWLMSLLWIILHWVAWFVALIWSFTRPASSSTSPKMR